MEMLLAFLLVFLSALLAPEGGVQAMEGSAPTNLPINGVQLFLALENRTLPDYSAVKGGQLFNNDRNSDGVNDALWCQSANNMTNIGVWYYPNGTEVLSFSGPLNTSSSDAPNPVFSKRFSGQIALVRRRGIGGPNVQGLYKCIIPDESGTNQTLVVGAYANMVYNNNDGPDASSPMQFSLLSTSRLDTPPVFSLSFNVSDGPPTTVSCSVNGNGISTKLSRVILNGPGSYTRVTVTVRLRKAGNYQCTVSNDRVTDGTISNVTAINGTTSLNVSVSDTPTGLTATRLSTGLAHVRLSWSTVSEATGYEVFYQLSNNDPISMNTTTTTSFDITTILMLGNTYTFYVVSYIDTYAFLPSRNSSTIVSLNNPEVTDLIATNITSTSFNLSWSPPANIFPPNNFNIQFECHRLCELSSSIATQASVSSPYVVNDIAPYSNCAIDLIGLYDEGNYTLANTSVQTLSTVPSKPVSTVTFASVSSISISVSWDEVPCDGQNGFITGYYLTYNSGIVNITGGDNRTYIFRDLLPYTNYTVSIMPYNVVGMGPPSDNATQQTLESTPSSINGLMMNDFSPYSLLIVWNPPTMPNGIITVYEIRYRESISTDPHNITNTTSTQYNIVGLTPNTSYTIEVRAFTSIGPGEWTEATAKTPLISSVQGLMVIPLNASSVYVSWMTPNISPISYYTLYYNESTDNVFSVNLSNTSTHGVITGLTGSSTEHEFRISVTIGDFEGQLSGLVQPVLLPPNVTIVANGTQSVGESYNMTCIVSVLDLLIPSTEIQWSKTLPNDTLPSLSNGETTSIHYIKSLNTSDAGQYTCTATISLTDIEIEAQSIDSHTITLEIPPPTVSISFSRETDLTRNPNGVIIQYNLTVTNLDTASTTVYIINVTDSNEIIESLIIGFSPYQNYTASVSASTIIGAGPVATTAGRTLPDVSSPVLLVTIPVIISGVYITESVPSISDTAVNLTWRPPLYPNGRITGYNITNDNNGRSYWIPIASVESVYSRIVTELNIGVLYNFTIRAFNELGGGESASVSAFSKPDTLLLSPPERVEATLSHDKTTITISWDSKTFDEVGAFFAYKVTATTTSTRKRQSGSPIEMIVPYNTTSVSFTGVNPNLMYQITASYITYSQNGSEMTGPPSNPVTPVNAVSSSTSSMQTVLSTTSVTSSPTLTPTLFEDTKNSPYIIGAAIGGLLVIFIILIIIVLLGTVIHRRRHTTGKMTLSTTNDPIITSNNEAFELTAPAPPRYDELTDVVGRSEHLTDEEMIGVLLETEVSIRQALNAQPAQLNDDTLDEDEEQEIAEEPVYVNIGDHNEFKPIHVSVFHSHVLEMHSNSDQEFDNEFKSIPMTSGAPYTVGSSEANIPKNRFLNIFPYDATRVVLTTKRDSDYINACFVDVSIPL
uniref:Protein-tyrosine-phosphatase n=1 Tax=Amphimedon queenslandica TaxID=400682 RepID=A0A1X7TV47_AMPQE